jgi:hypothetical protein
VLKNAVAQAPMHRVTIALIKERVAKAHGLTVKEMDKPAPRSAPHAAAPDRDVHRLELTGARCRRSRASSARKITRPIMYARDKVADRWRRRSLPQQASVRSSPKSSPSLTAGLP